MGLTDRLKTSFKGALKQASAPFWHTDFLPTGIFPVDHALGGGFGYGRVAEILGEWSAGKTMVLYYALIENARRGGISILGESEGAFNADFFTALGGNPEQLWVFPLDTVEEFFDMVITICDDQEKEKSQVPVMIGWDGIAATGTKHLQEVGMDKIDMSKPNAMNRGCQLIGTRVKKCKIAVVATNQTRERIGNNDSSPHGPGGKAWPFLSSQRIYMRYDGGTAGSVIWNKDASKEIGRRVRGQVIKNKLAAPFAKFVLPIYVAGGHWHPEFDGVGTALGIDRHQALFENYKEGYITYKNRPVVKFEGGWYRLDAEVAGESDTVNFHKKDWLTVLGKYPQLWGSLDGLKNATVGSASELPGDDGDSADGDPGEYSGEDGDSAAQG